MGTIATTTLNMTAMGWQNEFVVYLKLEPAGYF
jgi:hypothetical protein